MAGVDAAEWESLLERGRQQGSVHAEEVTHVLRHVELTGDVLDSVAAHADRGRASRSTRRSTATSRRGRRGRRRRRPAERLAERDVDDAADEHLLSRRRRRRVSRRRRVATARRRTACACTCARSVRSTCSPATTSGAWRSSSRRATVAAERIDEAPSLDDAETRAA